MPHDFDLIVIGTGAGGSTPAHKCRERGQRVAVVDDRPYGGTCALRGCDPKKVLVGAAELVDWNRRMADHGVSSRDPRMDWSALMRFKETFTQPVSEQVENNLRKKGIETFHGAARFLDRSTIEVDGERLRARAFVIAAGARPGSLDIPGEELLTNSDAFLSLESLPARIVFVGGGYISFEFAHIAARAGAKVTILHRSARPLAHFDPDLVERLVEATRSIGVDVRLERPVRGIQEKDGGFVVEAGDGAAVERFGADLVVHGAGRVPHLDELHLEAAEIKREKNGVTVNEYLQSVSNPSVYAAGDAAATAGAPLTPVAGHEGHIVASNLLNGNHRTPDYSGISSVVFTVPPLASVGMQEQGARAKGVRYRVETAETSEWYSSRRIAERWSGYKVLVEEDSEHILGAHLLGAHSEEIVNLFALAIRARIPAKDLKRMIWAYPTRASDISYMV